MSRRKLLHGKAARLVVDTGLKRGPHAVTVVVRGDVKVWRAERGIQPHGLRPASRVPTTQETK